MRKRTIVILFSLAFGIGLVGVITIIISSVIFASMCGPNCGADGVPTPTGPLIAVIIGLLIFLGGFVLGVVSWIGILVKQAQQKQWAWFTWSLILGILLPIISGIFQLIYLLSVPETPAPGTPGYMPGYQQVPPYQPYPPMAPYSPPAQPYPPTVQYPPAQQYPPSYPPQE